MTKDSALSPRSRGDSAIVASALLLYLCAVLPLGSLADANASFSAAFCPDGWNLAPNRNKCFIRLANSLPWNDSEALCGQFGGHLASLQSPEDLTFAQSLCIDDKDGCWIGGHGRSSNSGYVWNWSDDFALWNGSIFTVEPSHAQATDLCTLLTRGKNTTVAGENCNASHSSICATERESKCYRNHCHREYLIVIAVVSLLILTTALVVVVWLLLYKRSKRHRRSRKASSPAAAALVPPSWRVFSSEEVRAMTKNFSEGNRLAGDAKTGGTYGGVLADGTKVAVKRLRKSRLQRKKEFFAEVARVVKLHHPNLIGVKGCCYDHGDRYILYEFIGNGSLDRWLHHGARGGKSLDWGARMKIATTLARAIAFLHDKVKPQVVHRDVRASNVLLDEEFGAHLMGVGLSKFVYWEVMHERTKVAGSAGYLAPEFMYQNELTTKSDVFSFGVLLLEIVSGRRPAQVADAVGGPSILHWATPLVQAHRYMDLLDPLILARPDPGTVHKVVDLVYACTQIVPSVRPRMSHVVHQLQQISATTVAAAASASASATSASPASSSSMLPLEVVMGPP